MADSGIALRSHSVTGINYALSVIRTENSVTGINHALSVFQQWQIRQYSHSGIRHALIALVIRQTQAPVAHSALVLGNSGSSAAARVNACVTAFFRVQKNRRSPVSTHKPPSERESARVSQRSSQPKDAAPRLPSHATFRV